MVVHGELAVVAELDVQRVLLLDGLLVGRLLRLQLLLRRLRRARNMSPTELQRRKSWNSSGKPSSRLCPKG